MKFTMQVLIESPGALPLSVPIQTVDRPCERVEDVGLRLQEAKAVLQGLREQLIRHSWRSILRPSALPRMFSIASYQRLSPAAISIRIWGPRTGQPALVSMRVR
jgi:hypothetical protein